jgi:uncharacterized protein (UPF0264 family)
VVGAAVSGATIVKVGLRGAATLEVAVELLRAVSTAVAADAHARGLTLAVAGQFQLQQLPLIAGADADLAGLGSAVCDSFDRSSRLSAKPARRAGATDHELIELIRDAVWRKELKHRVNDAGFVQPARSMSAIGG